MSFCDRCNQPILGVVGECFCMKFIVVDEVGDSHDIYANLPNEAATAFAQDYNEDCGYTLMGHPMNITVDGKPYRISAETRIHYSSTAL